MSRMVDKLSVKEKYRLYETAVQCFESDIEFLKENYKKIYDKEPLTLREDFGGTAALACSWVKEGPKHFAWGVDIDPEPMNYGPEHHYSKLTTEEKDKQPESKLLVDSSVLGVEGIRGSGKTLFATYLTLHAQEVLGAKVFHNGALSFGEYIPVEDLISLGDRLRNAIIFIDEIQTLQDSYRDTGTMY